MNVFNADYKRCQVRYIHGMDMKEMKRVWNVRQDRRKVAVCWRRIRAEQGHIHYLISNMNTEMQLTSD